MGWSALHRFWRESFLLQTETTGLGVYWTPNLCKQHGYLRGKTFHAAPVFCEFDAQKRKHYFDNIIS